MSFASQTIPTTTNQYPITDYTPEKQSPSFSGQTNSVITITALTGTSATLTAAQVLGGFVTSNNASAQTITLPAASDLIAAIESAEVGSSIKLIVKELGAGTATVAAGTGGTIVGTATIAQNNIKTFLIIVTGIGSSAAYSAYSLGTSTF